ncbi:uncharacterized protein LOC142230445 [Haematobia irritans]|uniref:uncharacterized protein LOC142230445 n=1 Tax=Haematobia irritans TaxID=7368 RepID=UPI003F502E0B
MTALVSGNMFGKVSALAVICIVILLVLVLVVWVVRGSTCDALQDCDQFMAVCASSGNEHQFFYSQCDMVRDICLTGRNWKPDHFSHCNVN